MIDVSHNLRITPVDDSEKEGKRYFKDKEKKKKEIDEKINELMKKAMSENSEVMIKELKNLKTMLDKDEIEDVALKLLSILDLKKL